MNNTIAETQSLQMIAMRCGDITVGLNLSDVQEINRQCDYCEVPDVSSHIRGVMNLRGEVITMVDLREVLQQRENKKKENTRNVFVNTGHKGHEVSEAENGVIALQKIEDELPDLVFCDMNMPEMTGMDLLKTLRDKGIVVKFCFITSEFHPEFLQQATEAGAAGVLSKPFSPEQFDDTVGKLLAA